MKIPMLPMECWGNVANFITPSEFGKLLQVNKTFFKDLWDYTPNPEPIAKRIAHLAPKNLFKMQPHYLDHFQIMLIATTTDYTCCLDAGETLKNELPQFKKIIKNSLAASIIDSHVKEPKAENEETQTDEDKQFDKLIIDTLGTNKKNTLISQLCQLLSPENDEVTFDIENLLKIRAVARHALKNSTFFLQVSQGNPSQFNVKKSILQLHLGDAELEL